MVVVAEVFVVSVVQPNKPYVNADHDNPKRLVVHGDTIYLGDEWVGPETGEKVQDGKEARLEDGRFIWTAGTATISVYDAEQVDEAAVKRSEASRKAAKTRKANEAAEAKKRSEAAKKAAKTRKAKK